MSMEFYIMITYSKSIRYGWKVLLVLFASTGLLTCFIQYTGFWSSYVLDIVGPAWIYILIRAQYTTDPSTFFTVKFTPQLAFLLIFGICALLETSQYFRIYEAHFYPLILILPLQ